VLRPGRPEAAAAIWDWRGTAAAPAHAAPVWRRALVQCAIGLAIALALAWWGARVLAAIAAGIALFTLAAALASPDGLYRRIERALEAFARWVGNALTWLFMALAFYLIFLPFGLLFRRGRRDSMRRYFEADQESYWQRRDPEREETRSRERPF
jgi:hypothetical protein